MKKNNLPERRTRGYYKFSKKYPSRLGSDYVIGESRKTRKKERARKIVLAVLSVCAFIGIYIFSAFIYDLVARPLPEKPTDETPIITADNIGAVRAIYIENEKTADVSDLTDTLRDAKKNGFNAVMLDFKTRDGYLAYNSSQLKYSGTGNNHIIDSAVIDKIEEEGLTVIGRIFCFEDSVAPQRLGAFVYEDPERTKIWFDAPSVEGGKAWLNPTAPAASDYLCKIIKEVSSLGADCIYLESVQFPEARQGTAQYFTEDDASLNKNLVLLSFIERAVKSAGAKPVILGVPLPALEEGNAEKWGGSVFDTAAPVCSPLLAKPENGDYVSYVKAKSAELNERVKDNFSTIKVIPTVQNQPDDSEFFENISQNGSDSYIIIP